MKKHLVAAAISAMGLAISGSASAIVVGGVDFGSPGLAHLDTTTLSETWVNAAGQTLKGYGQVNTVNGNIAYAGADRLYFTFEYDVLTFDTLAGTATFDNGVVNVYKLATFNTSNQSSAANLTQIQGGQLWAVFNGHPLSGVAGTAELSSVGILTGVNLSFDGAGLLDVVAGGLPDVTAFLDGNSELDGMFVGADVLITTSGNNSAAGLNTYDDTSSCGTGAAAPGDWCIAGSADLRGATNPAPEPNVLALLGLGMLGLGVSMRKRKAA